MIEFYFQISEKWAELSTLYPSTLPTCDIHTILLTSPDIDNFSFFGVQPELLSQNELVEALLVRLGSSEYPPTAS